MITSSFSNFENKVVYLSKRRGDSKCVSICFSKAGRWEFGNTILKPTMTIWNSEIRLDYLLIRNRRFRFHIGVWYAMQWVEFGRLISLKFWNGYEISYCEIWRSQKDRVRIDMYCRSTAEIDQRVGNKNCWLGSNCSNNCFKTIEEYLCLLRWRELLRLIREWCDICPVRIEQGWQDNESGNISQNKGSINGYANALNANALNVSKMRR